MARKQRTTNLPAPFLRAVRLDETTERPPGYPYDLPWLTDDWEIEFDEPVTIFCGENGTGKSTLIEAIAALAGYDEAGGGKGYAPVDHSEARDVSGSALSEILRASWLPKVTRGWFFRAETFFSVARYLDEANSPTGDFLSHSHGEGFLRFFTERLDTQGVYFFDEPESALSPKRQIDLLRILAEIQQTARAQVIMATHSPLLMAVPGATLLRLHHRGIQNWYYRDTGHFRLYQSFTVDPEDFVEKAVEGDLDTIL